MIDPIVNIVWRIFPSSDRRAGRRTRRIWGGSISTPFSITGGRSRIRSTHLTIYKKKVFSREYEEISKPEFQNSQFKNLKFKTGSSKLGIQNSKVQKLEIQKSKLGIQNSKVQKSKLVVQNSKVQKLEIQKSKFQKSKFQKLEQCLRTMKFSKTNKLLYIFFYFFLYYK